MNYSHKRNTLVSHKMLADKQTLLEESKSLHNIHSLRCHLRIEVERAKRYNRPLSLLFCDIDTPRRVPDRYNSDKRKQSLLTECLPALEKVLRIPDTIYQYSDDDFVCILPETNLQQAKCLAERILHHLHKFHRKEAYCPNIHIQAIQYGVSDINISAGITAYAVQ